ncbi:MAG: hypothetical protein ACRDOS_02340 [Gaiellaceae bacterium]
MDPILSVAEETGQSHEELARHWAELFVIHDRLVLQTFERWLGKERAPELHRRVWENPTASLLEIFQSVGPTAADALAAYARAFMIHDYWFLRVLRDELGDVDAAEAHHSLWEGQAEDFALVHEQDRPGEQDTLSWEQLYRLYKEHCDREGLPYRFVEATDDKLVVEAHQCAYFDTISKEVGEEEAKEHNHLIAIDSTDRTIEAFFVGIGRPNEFRGVMTRHRCHGDSVCQIEFTRRDPDEPEKLGEPLERPGARCYWLRNAVLQARGPEA